MKKELDGFRLTRDMLRDYAPDKRVKMSAQMFTSAVVSCYSSLFHPMIISAVFRALQKEDVDLLYRVCAAGLGIVAFFFLLRYVYNVYLDLFSFEAMSTTTTGFCKRIYTCPYDTLSDTYDNGELLTRINNGSDALLRIFGIPLEILSNVVAIVVLVVMAGSLSWILLLLSALSMALNLLFTRYEINSRKHYEPIRQQMDSKSNTVLHAAVYQSVQISMYGGEEKLIDNYRENREKLWEMQWKQEKAAALSSLGNDSVITILRGTLGLALYPMFQRGLLDDSKVASSFSVFDQLRGVAGGFSAPFGELERGCISLEKMNEVLNARCEGSTEIELGQPDENKTVILVKNLSYRVGETKLLSNVNLSVKKGERVAIVGPNGCGKSTLMKAICGLYHPQSGYAAVNGVISAEMDVDDRRENFTYLPSTTYLYSIDSSQNILLNACGDEEYKLDTAIELAQIDNNGENSFLHSQKDQISGGQAQRVNIARAVIRKTPLLLADEPTAGLPKMQGEKILSDLLDEYETAVVVTHHRDQLKYFDRVIYMENGKIVSMNK